MPLKKNVSDFVARHILQPMVSGKMTTSWGPNRWKANAAESGLLGSVLNCWSTVAAVIQQGNTMGTGNHHAPTQNILIVVLGIYSKLPAPTRDAASHCSMYCSLSHPFPNNAWRMWISEVWAYLHCLRFQLLYDGVVRCLHYILPTHTSGSIFHHQW
jgi:hypothetical protein